MHHVLIFAAQAYRELTLNYQQIFKTAILINTFMSLSSIRSVLANIGLVSFCKFIDLCCGSVLKLLKTSDQSFTQNEPHASSARNMF